MFAPANTSQEDGPALKYNHWSFGQNYPTQWVHDQWSHSSHYIIDDWEEFRWIVYAFIFVLFMGFALLGVVADVLFPEFQSQSRYALLNEFGTSLMYGGIHIFLAPFLLFLLLVSLVGWVLLPFYLTMLFIFGGLGGLHGAYWLLTKANLSFLMEKATLIRQVIAAIFLFTLGFIPVIGPILVALLIISGLGSMTLTLVRQQKKT